MFSLPYHFISLSSVLPRIIFLVYLLILSLFFLFIPGLPEGSDLQLELVRIILYKKAIFAQGFPPLHAPELYGGYGSPLFLFYSPLFLITTALFSTVFSLVTTAKLSILFWWWIGGWGMYRLLERYDKPILSMTGSILFITAPYVYVDIFLRNAFAEFTALMLLPWLCYFLYSDLKKRKHLIGFSAFLALLAIAHNLLFMVGAMLCIGAKCIHVLCHKQWKQVQPLLLGILLGIGASLWFIIPMVMHHEYINIAALTQGKFEVSKNFMSAWTILFTPHSWFFAHILVIPGIILNILSLPNTDWRRDLGGLGACILWISCLVLITPWFVVIWKAIPALHIIQFPWRLLAPFTFFFLWNIFFCLSLFMKEEKKYHLPLITIGTCLLILFTSLNIPKTTFLQDTALLTPEKIQEQRLRTTVGDDYLNPYLSTLPKTNSTIAHFRGTTQGSYERCSTELNQAEVEFPLFNAPYWKGVTSEGQDIAPNSTSPFVTFPLTHGNRCITLTQHYTSSHMIGFFISSLALISLLYLAFSHQINHILSNHLSKKKQTTID